MKIQKIAYIQAKVGLADALRQALIDLEKATVLESGCVFFSFYQSLSDMKSFVLIECFLNNEALELHMQLPHTVQFFQTDLVENIAVSEISEKNLPIP